MSCNNFFFTIFNKYVMPTTWHTLLGPLTWWSCNFGGWNLSSKRVSKVTSGSPLYLSFISLLWFPMVSGLLQGLTLSCIMQKWLTYWGNENFYLFVYTRELRLFSTHRKTQLASSLRELSPNHNIWKNFNPGYALCIMSHLRTGPGNKSHQNEVGRSKFAFYIDLFFNLKIVGFFQVNKIF